RRRAVKHAMAGPGCGRQTHLSDTTWVGRCPGHVIASAFSSRESAMTDPTPSGPLLMMTGMTKQYPGCLANDHVSLTVERHQIHALLGENGAGKSTLVKIIYGVVKPDEGE